MTLESSGKDKVPRSLTFKIHHYTQNVHIYIYIFNTILTTKSDDIIRNSINCLFFEIEKYFVVFRLRSRYLALSLANMHPLASKYSSVWPFFFGINNSKTDENILIKFNIGKFLHTSWTCSKSV